MTIPTTTAMSETHYYSAKRRNIIQMCVGIILIVAGAMMSRDDDAGYMIVGWLNVVMGVLFILYGIREFLNKTPRLTLDNEGVTERNVVAEKILWRDIDHFVVWTTGIRHFVRIIMHPTNYQKYQSRMTFLQRWLAGQREKAGQGAMLLQLAEVDGNSKQIIDEVVHRHFSAQDDMTQSRMMGTGSNTP